GRDLCGRRPAAAADHLRTEVARMRGELAEVLGCRMWIDDAAAGQACEPDVRERRTRLFALTHLFERGARGKEPGALIHPDRGDVELNQPSRLLGRRNARE